MFEARAHKRLLDAPPPVYKTLLSTSRLSTSLSHRITLMILCRPTNSSGTLTALLALAMLLLACEAKHTPVTDSPAAAPAPNGATAADTTADAAAPPSPTEATPPNKQVEAKPRPVPTLDATAAATQRKALITLLRDGRAAVKKGDHVRGMALFEQSLAIDPNDARVLSELGWAAFRAGELERAERATRDSVKHAREMSVKGASLYNLGRIEEERGKKEDAAQHYAESLAARPGNAVVQQRLDALLAAGTAAPSDKESCDFKIMAGAVAPTMQAVCAAFIKTLPAGEEDTGRPGCESFEMPTFRSGAHTLVPFAYLDPEEFGSTYHVVLAVVGPDSWSWSLIGYAYNPGMGYIHEDFSVTSLEGQQLIAGSAIQQVILGFKHTRVDGNYSENISDDTVRVSMSALDLSQPLPRWIATVATTEEHSTDQMIHDEEGSPELPPGVPSKTTRTATVTWKQGGYTVKNTSSKKMPHKTGDFTFEQPGQRCPFVFAL